MKFQPAVGLLLLLTVTGAQDTSERISEDILYDVGNIDRLDVTLSHSLGGLTVSPNPDTRRIGGKIEYYPGLVRPHIEYHAVGSRGKLHIEVEHDSDVNLDHEMPFPGRLGARWKDLEGKGLYSDLDIRLPPGIPMDVELELGLGEADLDLSQLAISDLHVECGLSDVEISMDTPNSIRSRSLTIETGLGDFKATGLANLRAKSVRVTVGLGSANLDLSGNVAEDMRGSIEVGLGSLNLVLPRNANIRLQVSKSFLSSVDVDDLTQEGDEWVSARWDPDRPTLEFEINVGLGSVDVDVK